MIYFVQEGLDGNIKIGYTNNVSRRKKTLQTSSPRPLRLLGYIEGDIHKEKELHKLFKKYNVQGEWFRASKDIINYLNDNTTELTYIEMDDAGKMWILKKMKK